MTILGTYDAGRLTAFTDKTGPQTIMRDAAGKFYNNGVECSDEFALKRLADEETDLTAAGLALLPDWVIQERDARKTRAKARERAAMYEYDGEAE